MRSLRWLVVLVALCGSRAEAQRIDTPYRFLNTRQDLGAFIGLVDAAPGRIGAGPQDATAFGIRYGYNITGAFVIEAEVTYLPTTRSVRDTVFNAADSTFAILGEANLPLLSVLGNLRFNITGPRTWNGLQPYLLAGGGATTAALGGDTSLEANLANTARFRFGTSFAGQMAAGVEWFPAPGLSLRADARNVFWKLKHPDAFRLTAAGRDFPASDWERNSMFSVGLSLHF